MNHINITWGEMAFLVANLPPTKVLIKKKRILIKVFSFQFCGVGMGVQLLFNVRTVPTADLLTQSHWMSFFICDKTKGMFYNLKVGKFPV